MALTYTLYPAQLGNRKCVFGRATFTSVTSGNIVTGLRDIESCQLTNLTDNSRAMVPDTTTTKGTIALASVSASDVVDFFVISK